MRENPSTLACIYTGVPHGGIVFCLRGGGGWAAVYRNKLGFIAFAWDANGVGVRDARNF